MRRHLNARVRRLVTALLAASVTVFALAGTVHNHDFVGRSAGASLAVSHDGDLRQATPCLACVVAHSPCSAPVLAAAPAPRPRVELLAREQDRPIVSLAGTSRTSRGPPSTSTILVAS